MNKISDEQTFFWLSGSQAHWATSRPRNGYSPKRCTERFFLMISERNFCEQRKCLLTARGVINGCNSQTGEAVYTVDFPEFYSEGCWFLIGEKLHWRISIGESPLDLSSKRRRTSHRESENLKGKRDRFSLIQSLNFRVIDAKAMENSPMAAKRSLSKMR